MTDIAVLVARFGAALHAAGLPVGPDRSERFARAIMVARPETTRELFWCATATLVSDPADLPVLARVFDLVFGGLAEVVAAGNVGRHEPDEAPAVAASAATSPGARGGRGEAVVPRRAKAASDSGASRPSGARASSTERLAGRDFVELTAEELAELVAAMRRLAVATPPRRTRRPIVAAQGSTVDMRSTLRTARRTVGHPVRLRFRRRRHRPRRLVVLCDISGSMAPYARALLQLVYCAAGGARAEVFTFATRLTRLTRVLQRTPPAQVLGRVGEAAPDWSSGTRIAASLKEFIVRYGARGLARGAVVLIISDGWETGDPAELGRQMARLSRLAYRIVWANPRTQSERYRPLVGGMAAAWPYCDAVVSAHRLDALDDLLAALAAS
ncbi:MAG TPA: VWA domain-containing protein [Micromonosporaceae bacterium]|jgi:hypothetical protein